MKREISLDTPPLQPPLSVLQLVGVLFLASLVVEFVEMTDIKGLMEKVFSKNPN